MWATTTTLAASSNIVALSLHHHRDDANASLNHPRILARAGRRRLLSVAGPSLVSERLSGDILSHGIDDDWVEGGVEATLTSAMHCLVARLRRSGCPAPAASTVGAASAALTTSLRLGSDEAIRDLALVHALLRSHELGRSVAPSELMALPSGDELSVKVVEVVPRIGATFP